MRSKPKKSDIEFNRCIIFNSLAYFVIAYYLVVFSFNIVSMLIANKLGFDVELFYYGFTHSGKKWTTDNVIFVFFLGNAFTLLTAVIFQYLYSKQRRYTKGVKLLYMWIYLISLIWFCGNIIIGAIFNFGIGTAMRYFGIPFFLRALLAAVTIVTLVYFGYRAQKHVMVSANLYVPKLDSRNFTGFFMYQIVIPILLGLVIIVLMKLPEIARYRYADILLLLSFIFFIFGLFFKRKSLESIRFKSHHSTKKMLKTKNCKVAVIPIVLMFIVLAIVRIGLMNGVKIDAF